MARYKSLLKRYEIVVAKKKRTCKHNRSHSITKGNKCLVIYEGEMSKPFTYCWECACEILKNTKNTITCVIEDHEE